ncbi:hypothetical protein SAMN05660349_00135 [Macellibacteroides fermentans]|uniref:Uncharacterized protein n=1 Tax=Parabacteroides chartae TaxID=1037355 RepID=A0A1T4ZU54_9BACT|nr:hypothetical protein SAMN05660349_00135 [Parabacteroides chartae]
MTDARDLSHGICHHQKPLQQRDPGLKMMDDRSFCENSVYSQGSIFSDIIQLLLWRNDSE